MHQKSNLEVDYTNQFGIDQCLNPRIKHNEKQQKWQTSSSRTEKSKLFTMTIINYGEK